jgi:hypothetical protein
MWSGDVVVFFFFFFQWCSFWGHLAHEESCITVQFILHWCRP